MPLLIAKHGSDTEKLGTLPAFRAALELKADGLYAEMMVSAEGQFIVKQQQGHVQAGNGNGTNGNQGTIAGGKAPAVQPLQIPATAVSLEHSPVLKPIAVTAPLVPSALKALLVSQKDPLLYIAVPAALIKQVPPLIRQLQKNKAQADQAEIQLVLGIEFSPGLKALRAQYPDIMLAVHVLQDPCSEEMMRDIFQLDPHFVTASVGGMTENMITQMHRRAIRVLANLTDQLSQQALMDELTTALKFRFDGIITSQVQLVNAIVAGSAGLDSQWQTLKKNSRQPLPEVENAAKKRWTDRLT